MPKNSRHSFITHISKGIIGASVIPSFVTAKDGKRYLRELSRAQQNYTPNDQVQVTPISSGDALLCNERYFNNKIMQWDPEKLTLITNK